MIKTSHLLSIFLPAIIIVTLAVFIRLVQYRLLTGEPDTTPPAESPTFVTTFPDDAILGDKRAGKTAVVFADLLCERCRAQLKILPELLRLYPGRVKFIVKLLPVTRFPLSSTLTHAYAYCAREQDKFLTFLTLLIATDDRLDVTALGRLAEESQLDSKALDACLNSDRPKNYEEKQKSLAESLLVTAVPAVFIDGQPITEPISIEGWGELLRL